MRNCALFLLFLLICLPCILGENGCKCIFPDGMTGNIINGTGYPKSSSFSISFKYQLFEWDSKVGDLHKTFDLTDQRIYDEQLGKGGCHSSPMLADLSYSFIPKKCLPASAQYYAYLGGNDRMYNHKENKISTTYSITYTGNGTCMPYRFYITDMTRGSEPEDIISYTFHNFTKIATKDVDDYFKQIRGEITKCEDDIDNLG